MRTTTRTIPSDAAQRRRLARRLAELSDRLEALRDAPMGGPELECWTAKSELVAVSAEDLATTAAVLRAISAAREELAELDRQAALRRTRRRQVAGQLSLLDGPAAA